MNISPDMPWSTTMKVALVALSVIGALVFVGSAGAIVHMLKNGGAIEAGFGVRMIAGAVWAVFTFLLMKHPEWKRHLNQ